MKKATLFSILICLLSFMTSKAQTCTIINNTTFDYKHISVDIDPSGNRTDSWYFVPASSTIAFANAYPGLAGGVPGAGAHFVKCATVEVLSFTWIGALYSDFWGIIYAGGPFSMFTYINPLTGGTCTWSEVYDPTTGEHDVTITIN